MTKNRKDAIIPKMKKDVIPSKNIRFDWRENEKCVPRDEERKKKKIRNEEENGRKLGANKLEIKFQTRSSQV